MDYPKFIVSNQKEESIIVQRVKEECSTNVHQEFQHGKNQKGLDLFTPIATYNKVSSI